MQFKSKDMSGFRSGRLLVVGLAEIQIKGRCTRWLCRCDCGQEKDVDGQSLRRGLSRSCGCLQIEGMRKANPNKPTHGMKKSREYGIWSGILARCNNPTSQNYRNYGARGIAVCERWMKFENFYADMGPKPTGRRISIERKDNSKGYSLENCHWADMLVQGKNRRTNLVVTAFGETKALSAFFQDHSFGRDYDRAYQRITKHGWDAERAISEPSLAG